MLRSFPLNVSVFYQVIKTVMQMKASLYRTLLEAGYGVTPEQWSVLCCLWEEEGLSHGQIARKTGRNKFTISRIINLPEKKELVFRKKDPADKRRANIFLTQAGQGLKEPLTSKIDEFSLNVFKDFSTEEIEQIKALNEKITAGLK